MENIRKHRDIKLVMNKKAYLKKLMKLNFKSRIIFTNNLMGCKVGKTSVLMDKPVYLRQTIFYLSKINSYEFHCDYMKPKYGENFDCVTWTPAPSFTASKLMISTKMATFDMSGYGQNLPLPIGVSKKVTGLMKDEMDGKS